MRLEDRPACRPLCDGFFEDAAAGYGASHAGFQPAGFRRYGFECLQRESARKDDGPVEGFPGAFRPFPLCGRCIAKADEEPLALLSAETGRRLQGQPAACRFLGSEDRFAYRLPVDLGWRHRQYDRYGSLQGKHQPEGEDL